MSLSYHTPFLQGILVHLNVVVDVDRISYFDKVLDMFYFSYLNCIQHIVG